MSTLKYSVITFGLVAGLVSPTAALATNDCDAQNHGHQTKYEQDHKSNDNHKDHKKSDKDDHKKSDKDDKKDHDKKDKDDHKDDHKNHDKDHGKDCDEGGKGGSEPTPTPTPSTTPAPTVTPAPTTTPAPVGGNGAGQVQGATTLPVTGAADLGLETALALGLGVAGFVLAKRFNA